MRIQASGDAGFKVLDFSPPLLCVVTSETAESGPLRSPVKPIFEARLRQLSVRFLKRTWNTPGHVMASQLFPQGLQRRFVQATRSIVTVVCLPAPLAIVIVHRQAIRTLHTSSVCSKTLPARVKDRRGPVGRVPCPTAASEGTELKIKIDHSRISVLILYLSFLSCPFSA